jgi:peptide/nickel transport system substrate-binding protein
MVERDSSQGQASYDAMCELQILDDTSPKYAQLDPRQFNGSAYGMVAAARGYQRPIGDCRKRALADLRVRQAIMHSVDVASLTRFVGPDVAIPGRSVVPQGYLGETADVPRYAYDVEKAKALLAAAGFANGLTIRSVVSSIPTQLPIMEQVQAQLKKVGITLDMDVVDHPTYHARIRQDLSALTFYGAARFPIADTYLTQFYHSRSAMGGAAASLNFAHCTVADAEIDAARSETDPARQLALWAEAQRKIMAAACGVPLYDLLQVWVRTAKVDYGYKLEGALSLAPPVVETTRLN